jgi:hypothetical protein
MTSTVPPGRGLSASLPTHFVPGYDRLSLRDKSHSPIEGPRMNKVSAYGVNRARGMPSRISGANARSVGHRSTGARNIRCNTGGASKVRNIRIRSRNTAHRSNTVRHRNSPVRRKPEPELANRRKNEHQRGLSAQRRMPMPRQPSKGQKTSS